MRDHMEIVEKATNIAYNIGGEIYKDRASYVPELTSYASLIDMDNFLSAKMLFEPEDEKLCPMIIEYHEDTGDFEVNAPELNEFIGISEDHYIESMEGAKSIVKDDIAQQGERR